MTSSGVRAEPGESIAVASTCPPMTEKQSAILDAATAVFLREGYERASVDTIAAEAGVSKRTIYNNFRDKKELFVTVVERARARANEFTPDDPTLLIDPTHLDAELVMVGERLLNVLLDPESAALRRVILAEVVHDPSLAPACKEGTPKVIKQGLADRFARLSDEGALEIDDPMLGARQFIALIMFEGEKLSAYGTQPLNDEERHTIAADAARLFLRAYRPRS